MSPAITAQIVSVAPLLFLFVAAYFLLIRPQQQRVKAHANKVAAVKVRDMVVTGGGLIGKVTKVDDSEVEVEIASGVKVRAIKATLSDVTAHGSKPAND